MTQAHVPAPRTPHHDAVALAPSLWRSPAAFRIHLRSLSARRLAELGERAGDLPAAHHYALVAEVNYRHERKWMQLGGDHG